MSHFVPSIRDLQYREAVDRCLEPAALATEMEIGKGPENATAEEMDAYLLRYGVAFLQNVNRIARERGVR